MFKILRLAASPLLSLFILILGNGLFTTLITLRLHEAGVSSPMIGAMTGFYYAGLVCASFRIEHFIIRVGHIRAFATFASGLAVISLLHGIFTVPSFWLILRFFGGFATAGLFIVIESWLLILGTVKTRGQVLALYMATLYAAQALGQFLINIGESSTLLPYVITAMLCSLSVIPLAMCKIGAPEFEEPSTLEFKQLFKISAAGVIGCLCAGLILGSVYGLLPLFISQQTNDNSSVALYMALTIFGGMALQYPVGRISDYVERRTVMAVLSFLTVGLSLIIIMSFKITWMAMPTIFLFGGLVFTLYPISISHACDSLDHKDILAGTQGLLLAYSIGAAVGPFIAPAFIYTIGSSGLFVYFIVISLSLGFFSLWRRVQTPARIQEEDFILIPQTTPIAASMDPRGSID